MIEKSKNDGTALKARDDIEVKVDRGSETLDVTTPDEANNALTEEQITALMAAYKKRIEKAKRERFVFLLVGRTGVGKSSSVNSLMGKKVASVGDWTPETMYVTAYDNEAFGIKFTIIDTPGLCDGLPEENKDFEYLTRIQEGAPKFDCLWFVTRLYERRVTSDEMRAIKLLTDAYGKEAWKHAVIVFTFANSPDADITYQEAYQKRTDLLRQQIARWTDAHIAENVPAVAIDNLSKTTPDGEEWLGELYMTAFTRISERGFFSFLLATGQRLEFEEQKRAAQTPITPSAPIHHHHAYTENHYYPPSIPISTRGQRLIEDRLDEAGRDIARQENLPIPPSVRIPNPMSKGNTARGVTVGALVGAAVGSLGGPIGTVIGGAIGGFIGGLFSRRRK